MDQNSQPSPTVPSVVASPDAKKEIFSAGQTNVVNPQQTIDKKAIISSNGGGKRFPTKILLPLIVVVLLGVILLLAKTLIGNVNKNKEITITWWSLREDQDAVKPLLDEYKQRNPNVTINFVKEDVQDYRERLANSLAQGKGPDIFEFHNSWVPMFASNLVPTTDDFSSTFYPVVANDLKGKNGFFGVPLEYDGIALYVNQDIIRAYGKNAPKTWDDLRSLAKGLTLRDSNGNVMQSGVALGVTSNISYWQDVLALLYLQNGANLVNPSSDQGQSAITFYTNFSKIDQVWDDTLPDAKTFFNQGKLVMYFGKYEDASTFNQNSGLHYQVFPVPQIPQAGSISYASYFANGVSSASPNQAIAWDFLKFMIQKSSLEELFKNEVKGRGYGNLYPRVDMQSELLSDPIAGAFVYEASFARSWYLDGLTSDGATGINTLVAKPFSDAISAINGNTTSDVASKDLETSLTQVLASFGLVPKPVATP